MSDKRKDQYERILANGDINNGVHNEDVNDERGQNEYENETRTSNISIILRMTWEALMMRMKLAKNTATPTTIMIIARNSGTTPDTTGLIAKKQEGRLKRKQQRPHRQTDSYNTE